jgi:hypothetical protein
MGKKTNFYDGLGVFIYGYAATRTELAIGMALF